MPKVTPAIAVASAVVPIKVRTRVGVRLMGVPVCSANHTPSGDSVTPDTRGVTRGNGRPGLRWCGCASAGSGNLPRTGNSPQAAPISGTAVLDGGTAPAGCGDCLVLAGHWRPVEALDHKDRGSPSVGQRLADSHLTRPSDIQLRTTSFPVYGELTTTARWSPSRLAACSPRASTCRSARANAHPSERWSS